MMAVVARRRHTPSIPYCSGAAATVVRCLQARRTDKNGLVSIVWISGTLRGFCAAQLRTAMGVLSMPTPLTSPTPPPSSTTRDAIVTVWVPPIAVDDERAVALHTLGGAGGLVANLRSQILARGLPGVSSFCRGVRDAAVGEGNVRELDQEAFRAAASLSGAELTVSCCT